MTITLLMMMVAQKTAQFKSDTIAKIKKIIIQVIVTAALKTVENVQVLKESIVLNAKRVT
jgi:hypothetical protein